jgi:hypothetical protein
MRKIKDVLRLKLDAQLSHRQIAAALGLSKPLAHWRSADRIILVSC